MSDKREDPIEVIASELTYIPTRPQRAVKSAFWAKFSDNPICDPSDINLAIVSQFVSHSHIPRWWAVPGFKEWFINQFEFRQRIENLAHRCLERMEELLDDPETNANAVVNMMKMIMEIGRKMPERASKEVYLDEGVAEMSKAQLREYINKNIKLLPNLTEAETSDKVSK